MNFSYSFWRRWGMAENKTQLSFITELAQFNKLLADPTVNVRKLNVFFFKLLNNVKKKLYYAMLLNSKKIFI